MRSSQAPGSRMTGSIHDGLVPAVATSLEATWTASHATCLTAPCTGSECDTITLPPPTLAIPTSSPTPGPDTTSPLRAPDLGNTYLLRRSAGGFATPRPARRPN